MRYLILFTILLFPNLAADGQEVFNKNFQGVVLIITDDGIGSGAIITEAGHVLTNAHVINDNAQVEVYIFADDEIDNLRHSAKVLKVDKSKDLALLKIANSKFKIRILNFEFPKCPEIAPSRKPRRWLGTFSTEPMAL